MGEKIHIFSNLKTYLTGYDFIAQTCMNHIKCSDDFPIVTLLVLWSALGSTSFIRLDEIGTWAFSPTEIKFDILATKTDNMSTKTRNIIAVFEFGILL
jgi:hypothetical protein